jgi:DNA-binding response OmpR family regulator
MYRVQRCGRPVAFLQAGGERVGDILLMEDDELLRGLVAEWLTCAGYRTREADNAEIGLRLLRERKATLVVTDMHMPGLPGTETLSALHREFDGLPVIAISAHFRSGRGVPPDTALALGARKVLAKPFTCQELLSAVQELIGSAAQE